MPSRTGSSGWPAYCLADEFMRMNIGLPLFSPCETDHLSSGSESSGGNFRLPKKIIAAPPQFVYRKTPFYRSRDARDRRTIRSIVPRRWAVNDSTELVEVSSGWLA